MCFMFQTRPFWRCMRVPTSKLENRFEFFFGERNLEINDYENAKNLLMNIVTTIQNEMVNRIQNANSYDMFMKLYYIFDEVHAFYLGEKAIQLWVSYFANGGMCYSNVTDNLSKAMNERNQELSDILVTKIQEVLNKHYTPKFDDKDVKYQRIFGEREVDYGDFDVVYYTEETKELFLIEAKYFSDSLNSSGMVTDYKKLFEKGGYYDHCRRRYDLVLSEPENVKRFIGVQDEISVHLIFLSSKPIELEIQDADGVVTFLSLGIFEKYIEGKLITEDDSIVRPVKKI